jgi:putative transposase
MTRSSKGARMLSASFPNEASCLRLIRALASETDDEWLDGACYLNMEVLREQNKTHLPLAA